MSKVRNESGGVRKEVVVAWFEVLWREPQKNHSQDSWSVGRDQDPHSPENKVEMQATGARRSMTGDKEQTTETVKLKSATWLASHSDLPQAF